MKCDIDRLLLRLPIRWRLLRFRTLLFGSSIIVDIEAAPHLRKLRVVRLPHARVVDDRESRGLPGVEGAIDRRREHLPFLILVTDRRRAQRSNNRRLQLQLLLAMVLPLETLASSKEAISIVLADSYRPWTVLLDYGSGIFYLVGAVGRLMRFKFQTVIHFAFVNSLVLV